MAAATEILKGLAGAARRNRMPLAVGLVALALVVLAAIALPVSRFEGAAGAGRMPDLTGDAVEWLREEDLSAFLASGRWGVSVQEIIDRSAAEAAAAARAAKDIEITRELAEIGFVGLMVEPGEYAVLLVLPDGKISRLTGGDTLPDGRTLVSVTDNSLTLEGSGGQRDRLPLFPRVRTE